MKQRFIRRVLKIFGVVTLLAVASVALLIGFLWLDHTRSTVLSTPSGSYQVGRITFAWTDGRRLNRFAPNPGIKQELGVWIWYPAAHSTSGKTSDYLPAYWRDALARYQGFVMTDLLSRDLARMTTHSVSDAGVSPDRAPYPVIVLRAGSGALSTDYTSIAEDLASHGYVVVSFDAPYRTIIMPLPDGRLATRAQRDNVERMPHREAERFAGTLISTWIDDIKFVLDRLQQLNAGVPAGPFQGKLDMEKVGIVGHSLGGATAAQFCHDDARCKAGIDIDGMPFGSVIQQGLRQPFFFILSDHTKEQGPESRKVKSDIESIYNKLPREKRWQVTLEGANHFSFSDQMLTKSPLVIAMLRKIGVMGRLESRRGLAITSACVNAFFDVYLKGAPPTRLDHLPALYPEVKPGIGGAFAR